MKKYLIPSDEEILEYYKSVIDSEIDYIKKNTELRIKFRKRIREFNILQKFDEVYDKIQSCEAKMKLDYEKQYFIISDEYDELTKESNETYYFYIFLLDNISYRSENSKNGGKDIESKVVGEVLNQALNAYIEFDKKLININDKLTNLKSLFI